MRAGPKFGDIPCIFPVIREFNHRRAVRCGLPAQPTSRGFSGSLLAFAEPCLTSPELRRQLAVILSDLTLERASQRKNTAFLMVYLFWAVLGVTPANESMVPAIA